MGTEGVVFPNLLDHVKKNFCPRGEPFHFDSPVKLRAEAELGYYEIVINGSIILRLSSLDSPMPSDWLAVPAARQFMIRSLITTMDAVHDTDRERACQKVLREGTNYEVPRVDTAGWIENIRPATTGRRRREHPFQETFERIQGPVSAPAKSD